MRRENRTRGIGDLPINNIDWTLRRSVSSAKEGATTLFCPSTSRILRRLRGFASPAGLRYGCSQPVGASAVIGRADRESLIGLTMQDLEFTRNDVNGVMEELLISVDRPTGTTQASSPTTPRGRHEGGLYIEPRSATATPMVFDGPLVVGEYSTEPGKPVW